MDLYTLWTRFDASPWGYIWKSIIHYGKSINDHLVIFHCYYLLPGTRTDKKCKDQHLHLRLDLLVQSLQLVHVGLLGRPANAHTFLLIGLGDLCNVLVCKSSSWRNHEPIWKNPTMWK